MTWCRERFLKHYKNTLTVKQKIDNLVLHKLYSCHSGATIAQSSLGTLWVFFLEQS